MSKLLESIGTVSKSESIQGWNLLWLGVEDVGEHEGDGVHRAVDIPGTDQP